MIDPYLPVRRCDPDALPLPGVRCQRGGPEADQGFGSGVGVALRTSIRPPTHTSGQGMITNNKYLYTIIRPMLTFCDNEDLVGIIACT